MVVKANGPMLLGRDRGGSRIFFRRGAPLRNGVTNTNKPHWFCRITVVLECRRSSQGGLRTPCTLPLDPPQHETAKILNLLHIGPFQVNNVDSGGLESCVRENCKALFTGVGRLKGYELKLHIDESMKPVAQPVRRILFGLREKVDKKLNQLLEPVIIEELPDGPSMGDGDLRVSVDMHCAKEAIIRERHLISRVEELLHNLNGSTVFSKIDLKWGFHQILLSEDTSLCLSHTEVFIIISSPLFGVILAPKKYQQIVRDVLRGCPGVANIAGDLIILGRSVEEHD